jgi:hypothetical protein
MIDVLQQRYDVNRRARPVPRGADDTPEDPAAPEQPAFEWR